jgi:hypothetical protein
MPKHPGGRPTKLTRAMLADLVRVLEAGNTRETAAAFVGIPRETFHAWLKRGVERPRSIYAEFHHAVGKALATAKVRNVLLIQNAAREDWRAAAWTLEHMFPLEYAIQRLEVSGPGGDAIAVKHDGGLKITVRHENGGPPKK